MKISIIKQSFFLAIVITCLILPNNSRAARLWATGFELQSVVVGVEWSASAGEMAISTTTKRSGAASLSCPTGGDYITYSFAAGNPTVGHYFRFYLNIAGYPPAGVGRIFNMYDSGGVRTASVLLNTDGTLELWDADAEVSPVQLGSDSPVLQLNTWYRIEVAFDYIGAQDNTLTAYIDGVQFATGDDVGGTADDPTYITVGAVSSTIAGGIFLDDIAINDSTGTVQNSLPGAGSIVHLWPNAAGDTNTCNAGDYTSVDEEPTPDDATSYVECDDNNDILDVNMQASSVPGLNSYDNITLVQVGVRHIPETAAAISLTPRIKSQADGTVQSGTAFTHDDIIAWKTNGDIIPRNYKLVSYTDPQNTDVAWTPALLDTMQIGVTATDATPDAWISTLWALVEYTEGTPPVEAGPRWLVRLFGKVLRIKGGIFRIR